jgi:serine/threonine-protein kinase
MSKRRSQTPATPAAPREEYPSATVLVSLREVVKRTRTPQVAAEAWRLVVAASANSDFGVVADFALENELIASLEAPAGREVRNPVWTNPIDGSEMVWIPPGPFFIGSKNQPASSGGISLARHPVTNEQFQRYLEATGYTPPDDAEDPTDMGPFLGHWPKGKMPAKKERHPVVWVSFVDAVAYCRWAGLGLPSEWLWEKAARGPEGRRFPWGEAPPAGPPRLAQVHAADTAAVGSFPRTRSPYGCEDLVGNVSEWCQMLEGGDPGRYPPPWPGVPEGQVYQAVRGSCFLRSDPARMAAWHRRRLSVRRRNRWVGFRPACLMPYRPA